MRKRSKVASFLLMPLAVSSVHRLEPQLDRIQKRNKNTQTEIVSSGRINCLFSDSKTEVCNLTQTRLMNKHLPK